MDRLASILPVDQLPIPRSAQRLVQPLAILGGLYVASTLQAVTAWTWTHFLRRGNLGKYKSADQETWALVTGASDGIGKGFAVELAHRGYNVVLHGRNEKKLEGVKDSLQQQFPDRKFQLLILDADEDTATTGVMAEKLEAVKKLNVRILVNNVAGGGKHEKPIFEVLQNRKVEAVNGWINISCRFPTQLTRQMLPTLIAKPSSLILNIGSGISETAFPYLGVYSGCKSYNKMFSRSLTIELKAEGNRHVEVIAVLVGTVATERMDRPTSWDTPSTRQMAISALDSAGCGRDLIWAYWGHAVQGAFFSLLPQVFFDTFGAKVAKQMRTDEQNGKEF